MRAPLRARSDEIGINMTPMIDVVFQLIIFFLLTSHLAKQENELELPLPVADSGTGAIDENTPRVVINIRSNGDILLAGTRVTPEELRQRLGFERERSGEFQLRIRGDRRVPYHFVEPIMLAAFRERIYDVTFAVYRSQDAPP